MARKFEDEKKGSRPMSPLDPPVDNALDPYVDNYDEIAPRLHPRARSAVEPYVDMIERSQVMRGARQVGKEPTNVVDYMGDEGDDDLFDAARRQGYNKEGFGRHRQEGFQRVLDAAAKDPQMQTDEGLMFMERFAKTYGLKRPWPGSPYDKDNQVTGGRRVKNLQMNLEQPAFNDLPPEERGWDYAVNPNSPLRQKYRRW